MDFPGLADCLGASVTGEVVMLPGDDPQSEEGQLSSKTGCPSVVEKWWSDFLHCCGLDFWLERTGLRVVFFSFLDKGWLRDGW